MNLPRAYFNENPAPIRVKISGPQITTWYATTVPWKKTPKETVAYLNQQARAQGSQFSYELATEGAYQLYRSAR